jgi:hypothetical protein
MQLFGLDQNFENFNAEVFSDDVCATATIKNMNVSKLNKIYSEMERFFLGYGFVIKPSQSMVSPTRTTLLKIHTFNGVRADTSLKRILQIMHHQNDAICNDSLLITSLNSTVNSAVDYTNQIILPQIIK